MTDRTAYTDFFPSTDPQAIMGRVNASNDDTFTIPYGVLEDCQVSSQDDDNAIVSADVSGSQVTLGCVDNDATGIDVDFDIVFTAIVKQQ